MWPEVNLGEGTARRQDPRLATLALCNEVDDRRDRPGFVVDLSPTGLRLERPYLGGGSPRELRLELELPDEDEVLWAHGVVRFDELCQRPGGALWRRTGVAIVGACTRDLRVLRDYVFDRARAAHRLASPEGALLGASCYARG